MPSRRARGRGRGGEARRRGKGPSRHARTRPSARTYPVSAAATSTSDTSRVNAARRVSARFSSSCRCLVSSSQPASETRKGKTAAGPRPEATRCAQTDERQRLSLFPHRVSYERQSHENSFCTLSFFETSTLRPSRTEDGRRIFRFHSHRIPTRRHLPGASSRTPHPLAVPGSSSSSLEVERTSLELLCSAPQRSRLRPKSTDCPFPRLLGSLASPPPGPPVRAPFSVSGARTLPAIASRVARSSATSSLSGGRASPRDSGASLVRRVGEKISPDVSHKKQSRDHAVSRLRLPASPPRRRPPRARHGRRREVPHRALRPRRDGPGASLAPKATPRSDRPNVCHRPS